MISYGITEMMAAERRRALLDAAAADRLARRARPRHGRDGSMLHAALRRSTARIRAASRIQVRPIKPSDAQLLREGFARLGPQSRRMRFLTPKDSLTPTELRYFTEVDHHDHEALVAVSRMDGRGLGVARYVRDVNDREAADVAVTIVDEWQGRGLGTDLLYRLSERARMEGIHRFTALISTENAGARRLLHKLGGAVTVLERGCEAVTYEVALAPARAERRSLRWYVLAPAPGACVGTP